MQISVGQVLWFDVHIQVITVFANQVYRLQFAIAVTAITSYCEHTHNNKKPIQ